MADGELSLLQKLAEIRKSANVMKKNKSGFGYNYVSEDEILAKITKGMEKFGVTLYPSVQPSTTEVVQTSYEKTKLDKNKNPYTEKVFEMLVHGELTYTWVDNSSGETLVVPWVMVGQQTDAAQAFGAALTYSNRYFLLKFFNVATVEDDPDKWRAKQREAEYQAEKRLAESIISEVDTFARGFIATHPDAGKDFGKIAKKYAKDGDYFEITDPVVASKLLQELKDTFKEA